MAMSRRKNRRSRQGEEMSYTAKFIHHSLPHPVNVVERMPWQQKRRYVRELKAEIAYLLIGKKPKEPLFEAKLTLVRCSSSEPDFDGLVSSFKYVVDTLKDCGVIVDDKMRNIGQSSYQWEYAPPKKGMIIVVIEEIIPRSP